MKSIALKLWLGMMALVSVVLILLWFSQIVFLDRFYSEMRVSGIQKEGAEIIGLLSSGQQAEFKKRLDELAYNNNATVELLNMDRQTLYATGETGASGMLIMMHNKLRQEAINQVLTGQTVLQSMLHPRFDTQFMLIGLPIQTDGILSGALIISLPMVAIKDTVAILKEQLLYITIILLIAALVLSFLLSKTFTRPILDITKVSQEMAAGNLSARIKLTRADEIGRLALTINRMGEELTKIDQLRKDLIANVSHELRTPLSIIKGFAETIRDISGDNREKREKQIAIIIEESDRLSTIVDDILNLSQLQSGYLPLQTGRFMINETLDRVIKRYELLSGQIGIGINLINTGAISVQADQTRIEQVLYNLINNAFNHSRQGDLITITALDGAEKVKIEVSDTGPGIPEDEIASIWDRFYKVDKSGQRNSSGSGLGLAIVKNILIAHQSAYGVKSQVGLGTTFWFELKK